LCKPLIAIGLFEKNSSVKPMSPLDVLGACTEELDHRFDGLDAGMRDEIMKDMQIEDETLKPYIERCRLDKWFQGALDLAKQDFTEDVEGQTDDGDKMLSAAQRLREIEQEIAEKERRTAESLLHSKPRYKPKQRLDSSTGRFRSSTRY
jgi:nuclear pore complex protein Nup133